MTPAPLRVGLTGGIASGKTLVARILRELGAAVVDADQIAREVLAPGGAAYADVAREFPEVVGPDGRIDRRALAARVFGDPAARKRLNRLTHPPIRHRMAEEAQRLAATPGVEVIVFDVPLLLDTTEGRELGLSGVIVVYADEETRLRRLMARDGISEAEARQRLAAQVPLEEKVRRADWVVDNRGTPEDTRRAVERLWAELVGRARAGRPTRS